MTERERFILQLARVFLSTIEQLLTEDELPPIKPKRGRPRAQPVREHDHVELQPGDHLLSVREAGAIIGASYAETKRQIASGELKSVKRGRRRLVPHSATQAHIKRIVDGSGQGS